MLSFDQYPADFGSPSFSAEMHGNESKPLMSIYVEAVVNAANLESFKPGLQASLWHRPAINDSARMDEDGKVHELVRRFPTIKTVHFDDKLGRGYTLTITGDLLEDEQTWADVEIGKVSIEPQDGGTARIKFRVQCRGEGLETWVGLMNASRSITLTPPASPQLPADHPDAKKDDPDEDRLSGSLEFGRDAQGNAANEVTGDGTGEALPDAPEGFTADTLKNLEAAGKDAAQSARKKAERIARAADKPAGKKARRGAAEAVH